MLKRFWVILAVGSVSLCLAASAWAATPANGVYQGIVNGSSNTNGHSEGEGFLRIKTTASGKRIVPPGAFACGSSSCQDNHITAPSFGFKCNQLNVNLVTKSIPVVAGAFDSTGVAPIGPSGANRHVHFKGSWVSGKRVKGFTRITGGWLRQRQGDVDDEYPPPGWGSSPTSGSTNALVSATWVVVRAVQPDVAQTPPSPAETSPGPGSSPTGIAVDSSRPGSTR